MGRSDEPGPGRHGLSRAATRATPTARPRETTGVYIAAIDQGTTSTRCIVFDAHGQIVGLDQREHRQHYPRPGWVEHDAEEIWHNVGLVLRRAVDEAGLSRADITAIGITNQRETTVLWDRVTGEPVAPAIVWQDTRTDALVSGFAADGLGDLFRERRLADAARHAPDFLGVVLDPPGPRVVLRKLRVGAAHHPRPAVEDEDGRPRRPLVNREHELSGRHPRHAPLFAIRGSVI